jgi:hypothetical protein
VQRLCSIEALELGLRSREKLIEEGTEGFRRAVFVGIGDYDSRAGR